MIDLRLRYDSTDVCHKILDKDSDVSWGEGNVVDRELVDFALSVKDQDIIHVIHCQNHLGFVVLEAVLFAVWYRLVDAVLLSDDNLEDCIRYTIQIRGSDNLATPRTSVLLFDGE